MSGGAIVLLIGAVVFVVGGILIFTGRRTQAKTNLLRAVATSNAADIAGLLPGEMVEVKGAIRSDTPLTSQHASRPSVWYESTVSREYEERDKDSQGNWRTTRGSESVSTAKQAIPFFVEDASGRVRVNPDGADIDAPTVLDRFDDKADGPSINVSIGGIELGASGRRTLGYRYVEKLLAVDTPVYVLGTVREDGEIGAPANGGRGRKFVISHRSEEALEAAWSKSAHWQVYIAIGLLTLGVIMIVGGLVASVV